ncbi:MAG: class I SAM-dependent methyltransferase [Magnetococcus sp. YQC-3]
MINASFDLADGRAPVGVLVQSAGLWSRGLALATRLSLPLADVADPALAHLWLVVTEQRLELRSVDPGEGGAIYVEFVAGRLGFRRQQGGGVRQPLARAVGLRGGQRLTILDATPGLGQDAFVLAALGADVEMVERSPVLVAMLEDGLRRLAASGEALPLAVLQADAREVLRAAMTGQRAIPDVVYLDPMYPHRDGTALSKKEMRRLRLLVGGDGDAPELLAVALQVARQRVVVKRPRGAAPLQGPPPTLSMPGKTTRYDLYLLADARLRGA